MPDDRDWWRDYDDYFAGRDERWKAIQDTSSETIHHIVRGERDAALRRMGLSLEYDALMAEGSESYDTAEAKETLRKTIETAAATVAAIEAGDRQSSPTEELTEQDLALLTMMVENATIVWLEKTPDEYRDVSEWHGAQRPLHARLKSNKARLDESVDRVSELRYLLDDWSPPS